MLQLDCSHTFRMGHSGEQGGGKSRRLEVVAVILYICVGCRSRVRNPEVKQTVVKY